MKEVFSILFGAGFTVAVSLSMGSLLLSGSRVKLHRGETALIRFIAGAGLLSFLVTLLCLIQEARKGVFLWGGVAAIALAVWRRQPSRRPLPAVSLDWMASFVLITIAFFIYYFINALAPEVSPDGSGYHLGNVVRIWRHHGFVWDYRSLYSYLSQGTEMLFLVFLLIALWLLGFMTSYTLGGLLNILLVVAIILFLVHVIQGRPIGD